jgi:SWI/SNF-related matrix-associated actin-dependent regulator of chromatin subfamily A3
MSVQGSNKIYNSFVEDCAHVLCSECLEETDTQLSSGQVRHCPICLLHNNSMAEATLQRGGRVSSMTSVVSDDVEMTDGSPTRVVHGEEDDDHYFRPGGHSTKMEALVKDVKVDLESTKR